MHARWMSAMKSILILLLASTLFISIARGQEPLFAGSAPQIEASLGYSYLSFGVPSSGQIPMQGADATVTANLFSRIGAKIDLSYTASQNVFSTKNHSDAFTYLGGPVVYALRRKRFLVSTEFLIGGGLFKGVIPAADHNGYSYGYSNQVAWAAGGGFQFRILDSIETRVGIDYIRGMFLNPSFQLRGQSNFRTTFSAVYVLRRHHPRP